MAKFKRLEVVNKIVEQGMMPLFYHPDIDLCKHVVKACYHGGARLLEFTNRGDFAHESFGELVRYCDEELPEMILGIGSIADSGTAALYLQLGANFVVTPSLREDIGVICNRRKVLWMPGCGSLTEIGLAEERGAEIVKLFPGSIYGPSFVKAIKGPQPWTSIMPTGGVTPEYDNLKQWFDAGVSCVGLGSQLITKELVANQDFDGLTQKVNDTLNLIMKLKTS